MEEKALREGPGGNGEERSPQSKEVFTHDEDENDNTRVDLRGRPDDFRVEEVRFDLMDSEDPKESPKGRPKILGEADENRGNSTQYRAENRDKTADGGH